MTEICFQIRIIMWHSIIINRNHLIHPYTFFMWEKKFQKFFKLERTINQFVEFGNGDEGEWNSIWWTVRGRQYAIKWQKWKWKLMEMDANAIYIFTIRKRSNATRLNAIESWLQLRRKVLKLTLFYSLPVVVE